MKRKRKKERKKKGVGGKSLGLRWLYGGWVESWSVWTKERRIWKRKRKERKGAVWVSGEWSLEVEVWCGSVREEKMEEEMQWEKKKWEKKIRREREGSVGKGERREKVKNGEKIREKIRKK